MDRNAKRITNQRKRFIISLPLYKYATYKNEKKNKIHETIGSRKLIHKKKPRNNIYTNKFTQNNFIYIKKTTIGNTSSYKIKT